MVKKVYIIEETDGNCYDIVKNITKYLYNNKDILLLENESIENVIINKAKYSKSDIDQTDIFRIGYGSYKFVYNDTIFKIEYNISNEKFALDCMVASYKTLKITFLDSLNPQNEKSLSDFLKIVSAEETKSSDKLFVYTCDEYGEWNLYNKLPSRKLEFIYMDEKLKKSITDDIKKFLESEDDYNKFGMPYKKTFLLTGVPGSGKTSLIKAICNHFNLNLYILSIQKKFDNSSLLNSLQNLNSKSILLIEDIDCLFQKRRSTTETPLLSFSNVLNILDGVLYKHGSIIFITTNHPEKLDNALIRIGRIDMVINFDFPRKEEIREMFKDVLGLKDEELKIEFDSFCKSISVSKMPMSALIGFLFRYRNNWKENISELIDTNNFIKKVVKGECESGMFL